ncbi:MAG: PKD domain-containing protein [Sphingobacteriales bacterium]|nr:PKD domain-containing protein [Sphingobacteriales bacterium]
MKNAIFVLILTMGCNVCALAQKYFEKDIVIYNYFQNTQKILPLENGNYIIQAGTKDSQEDTWQSFALWLNPNLDTIRSKHLILEGGDIHITDIVAVPGGYTLLIAIDSISGGYNWETFVMGLDTAGNELFFHAVGNPNYSDICRRISYHPDGFYLLSGGAALDGKTTPYIIKLGAAGNKLWEQRFGYCIWRSEFRGQGFVLDENRYQFWGNYQLDTPDDGDWLMIETDSMGNFVRDTTYHPYEPNDDTAGMFNPIQNADKSIVFVGSVEYLNRIVAKIDSTGNIVWISDNLFGSGGSWEVVALDDGRYIVGGTMNHDDGIAELDARMVMLSADGEVQWVRDYGNTLYDYGYAIAKTPDKGFLMAGRGYLADINTISIYLVKTNCMGLLTEPQAAFSTYQTGDSPLEVGFQNLSQYVYPDSIDGGYYVWDFGDGSPPFVCGQGYGACPALVTHNYATQGQYAATLTAFVCTDTATVTQQFSVVPTAVGQVAVPTYRISVLPNPASDVLHLEAVGALSSSHELQFSLYDAMGRAVRRLALRANGGSVRLDVADLPQGLYFWTCYSPDMVLQSGRVVIGER